MGRKAVWDLFALLSIIIYRMAHPPFENALTSSANPRNSDACAPRVTLKAERLDAVDDAATRPNPTPFERPGDHRRRSDSKPLD